MIIYADQVRSGIWEVFCCDCRKSLETMNYETLSRAMWATREKGGVKCPECRKLSCRRCGAYLSEREMGSGDAKLCWVCELYLAAEEVGWTETPLSS